MNFSVERECPQCGGRIELDEVDRFIHCPYCHVRNYLFARDYFRYYLPPSSPVRDVFYAPYMRFKGVAYFCSGTSVNHRIVDLTLQGVTDKRFPLSLGVRPQAVRLKCVSPEMKGPFLKNSLKADDMFNYVGQRRSVSGEEKLLHRAYLGETVNCIYLPLYKENGRLFDGVAHVPVSDSLPDEKSLLSDVDQHPEGEVLFMATLCPGCGWDLQGERDSAVLTCPNCDSIWDPSRGVFAPVEYRVVPGVRDETTWLPFWRIGVEDQVLPVATYADFVRIIQNPFVPRDDREDDEMFFWIPAFKIRPEVFLRLGGQMTLFQREFVPEEGKLPEKVFPITLARKEAVQALVITLAGLAWNEKKLFPLLPRIDFRVTNSTLVFLPFDETEHELIQQQQKISVHKNAMRAGRNL